ncbi:hypothetical protein ACHWQZ_G004838 [Mnemiopsis leidyi]
MSSELEQLKVQHEELRLTKRAIDRETEDTRTKTIEDKRVAEAEIEKLQLDLESLKEETTELIQKNKSLETKVACLKEEHTVKRKKQEEDYDNQRRSKQKLQFQEAKLCTKKVNIEKKCDPVEVHKLQIEELKKEVQFNKNEREEVKKIYETEMNKLDNVVAKLKFQKKTWEKKLQAAREELLKLNANCINIRESSRKERYDKDLLLQRLVLDTKRCQKSIPELTFVLKEHRNSSMSSELELLKVQHEELRLTKRAIDRETEDTRTKTIEDKRAAEAEIEKLQLDLESLKEETTELIQKNKSLETKVACIKEEHEVKRKKQEEDYDNQRRSKQKLQFQEAKLCTKKVNIEKKCDPVEVHKLQIEELKKEVQFNKNEREEVKKIYETEMNKLDNVMAKLKFQKKTWEKKLQAAREELLKLNANCIDIRESSRKELYEKDLLLQRLVLDTKRCQKSIPELEASMALLENMVKE